METVEVNVDILNANGEKQKSELVKLPIKYDEFVSNKIMALQFFMMNSRTKDLIDLNDQQEFQKLKSTYFFARSYTVLFTLAFNIMFMRHLYQSNLIFKMTRRANVQFVLLRFTNKFYFIPQFVGLFMDRFAFSGWFERNTNLILQKYDFDSEPYLSIYQEIIEKKSTQVTSPK